MQERRHAEAIAVLQNWKAGLPEDQRQDLTISVMVGEPFATIVDELDNHQMDLLVVGQPGKHGLKELFLGTTTERVVRFSSEPVLMVSQHPNGPYRRVLVAMDFSEGGTRAIECAYRISPGAEIRAIHAWQSPFVGFSSKEATAETDKKRLQDLDQRQIKRILEQASPQSPCPHINMIEGDPYSVIRSEIGTFNADLLVMGTHSRGRLAPAIIGSLAHAFLAEGPCDVLVARA